VQIVTMGRAQPRLAPLSAHSISVDLADPNQVDAAARTLANRWYGVSNSSSLPRSPGLDIVINNAGVFSGSDSGALGPSERLYQAYASFLWSRDNLVHKHPRACPNYSRSR
jgi:NAD(P)-dependent dehydrogenase (short-subunit alcohol dehydrogenase family)